MRKPKTQQTRGQPKTEKQISVAVAELKANLSRYLKEVKEGKDVVVTEHRTPVAIVQSIRNPSFEIRGGKKPLQRLYEMAALPSAGSTDSLSVLLEDRNKR